MVPIALLLERYITEYTCTIGNTNKINSYCCLWYFLVLTEMVHFFNFVSIIPRKNLPSMSFWLLLKLFFYALIGYASHVVVTSKDFDLVVP
jgi:hypothetical protein